MKWQFVVVCLLLTAVAVVRSDADDEEVATLPIDLSMTDRRFDGIGALSGGGATSRLLPDYDEQRRNEILDFLFRPRFGASLHILKTEIGGDGFSGCGTEPTHQRSGQDLSYTRGYEWWLMAEAKLRNPAIFGYGLSWSFPAWIGEPLSDAQVNYTVSWVQGALQKYSFDVRYVGIWNEQRWSTDYVKRLRLALDYAGLRTVGIVVADNAGWFDVNLLKSDPEFASAVAIAGTHYPVGSTSSSELRALGNLTLWSSEDSSTYFDEVGGGCWARILNWNWVIGEMTSTIMWNLVCSYLEGLRWYGDSLMDAAQPWSGNYVVKSPVWATAHTTQFTEPGWVYLHNGTGSGFLPGGGSYVTLVSDKNATDFSIIIETMKREHSLCIRSNPAYSWTIADNQTVTFQLKPALDGGQLPSSLHLWSSQFFGEKTFFFEKQEDVKVDERGSFQITVLADSVYTLTTTTGQQKGEYPAPPERTPFPVPYSEDFDNYTIDVMPKYFSDQCGSFAVAARNSSPLNNQGGGAFQQMVTDIPIGWHGGTKGNHGQSKQPLTVIGDWNGTGYAVSVEACIIDMAKQEYGQEIIMSTVLSDCAKSLTHQQWKYINKSGSEGLIQSVHFPHLCLSAEEAPRRSKATLRPCCHANKTDECWNQIWHYQRDNRSVIQVYRAFARKNADTRATCAGCLAFKTNELKNSVNTDQYLLQHESKCLAAASSPPVDSTNVVVAVNLGGPVSPRGGKAYEAAWYDFGYFFTVAIDGSWQLLAGPKILSNGTVSPPGLSKWHTMTLSALPRSQDRSQLINGSWDGVSLFSVEDTTWTAGFAGLGSGWHHAQFDNFQLSKAKS